MKKIKAKTQFKHAVSKGSFMKELLEIMGRLSIKLDDDELEVVDVQDECLSEVIDLIDDYSQISEIHICENEESSEEALAESSEMPSEQAEDEAVEEGARDEATNGSISDEIANIAESANDDESEISIHSSTDELEPEDAYDSSEDVNDAIVSSSISDDVPQDFIGVDTDVDTQSAAEDSSSEVAKAMAEQESTKNVSKLSYEEALNEIIGDALEEVFCFGTMTDEVRQFIANIGMDTSDGYLVQAFIKACEVKKITMDNIAGAVCVMAGVKQSHIENSLKKTFNQWIKQYPEFKAKFPKISLTAILKAFANKMRG